MPSTSLSSSIGPGTARTRLRTSLELAGRDDLNLQNVCTDNVSSRRERLLRSFTDVGVVVSRDRELNDGGRTAHDDPSTILAVDSDETESNINLSRNRSSRALPSQQDIADSIFALADSSPINSSRRPDQSVSSLVMRSNNYYCEEQQQVESGSKPSPTTKSTASVGRDPREVRENYL